MRDTLKIEETYTEADDCDTEVVSIRGILPAPTPDSTGGGGGGVEERSSKRSAGSRGESGDEGLVREGAEVCKLLSSAPPSGLDSLGLRSSERNRDASDPEQEDLFPPPMLPPCPAEAPVEAGLPALA